MAPHSVAHTKNFPSCARPACIEVRVPALSPQMRVPATRAG